MEGLHFASEVKALSLVTDDIHEFPAGYWFHSRKGWQQYYTVESTLQDALPDVQNEDDALHAIREFVARGCEQTNDVGCAAGR